MNSFTLKDYLSDIDNLTFNNISNNINSNKDLKNLILFFMKTGIKFYSKNNNKLIVKSKDFLSLEIKNYKTKILNEFVCNLLKFDNNFAITKDIIKDFNLKFDELENISFLLKNNFEHLEKINFNSNNNEKNYIAEYSN